MYDLQPGAVNADDVWKFIHFHTSLHKDFLKDYGGDFLSLTQLCMVEFAEERRQASAAHWLEAEERSEGKGPLWCGERV